MQGLIDLAPTYLSLAGLPPEQRFEGVDQSAAWTGEVEKVRDDIVVEDRPHDLSFNQRIYMTQRWKLVAYHNPAYGELYDMENDPHQVRNLWNAEDHRDLRFELMQGLLSHEMNKGRPFHPTYGK